MTDNNTPFKKFICRVCGYIYDEAQGDLEHGLPAGTRFDDISDDWVCPLCGASKQDFEPYQEVATIDTDTPKQGVTIVGAGLAGWAVVDAVRALDKEIAITLISADHADRYHKPMLSVAFSQGKSRADLVRVTGSQSALDNNITLLSQTQVTDIDPTAKTLKTTKGDVAYHKLVLAVGANPAYPLTIDPSLVWHVNHLDAFDDLKQKLTHAKTVAILGAGMVGVELAEDLVNAGFLVSLIDVNSYPLAGMFPSVVGERILRAITSLGVQWMADSTVLDVTDINITKQVSLQRDGVQSLITADAIIVATGLRVDDTFAKAGVAFDERAGVAVNPKTLQTDNPDIYALGDCISIDGVPCRYVAPHRPQALAIAHELLGLPHAGYQHKPPMIRLKNKSINVTANGTPRALGEWHITKDDDDELSLVMMHDAQEVAKVSVKMPK